MKRLVLIAGVVLVAAVANAAFNNFVIAMQRSKQKRTMADVRSVANAWEARATDFNTYVVAGKRGGVSYDELNRALTPTYIRVLPRADAWGSPFQFTAGDTTFSVRALGRDHRAQLAQGAGASTDFDRDIVFSNGEFFAYPEGT
jgi:type II secretory pathway pseudopilin PulG